MQEHDQAPSRFNFSGLQDWSNVILESLQNANETESDTIIWCDKDFST